MTDESSRRGIPSISGEDDDQERTALKSYSVHESAPATTRAPFLFLVGGAGVGTMHAVGETPIVVGRAADCAIHVDEPGISRNHARFRRLETGDVVVEDLGSANGTLVNGRRIDALVVLQDGDKIQFSATLILRLSMLDELDAIYERRMQERQGASRPPTTAPWSPDTWRSRKAAQTIAYDDARALEATSRKLHRLPPLVTTWEIEELKNLIAEAQEGRRFLLQGGDCAETLADCEPTFITNKLKILIQMSLVLIRGLRRPVIRVGRFAGQYAKPRTKTTETRHGVELPSYFGDLVNRPEFTADARRPNPDNLLAGYLHAAVTLNFIRSLTSGGFADLRRPEYFDLSFFGRSETHAGVLADYRNLCREITHGLEFLQAFGDRSADELMKVTFYASHEALNLEYEAAQTRRVPRRDGYYDLTTHLPWIGERTRALDGAHVEFFRGVANPVAVKIGPAATGREVVELCRVLNPQNEPGKLVLITRMGVNLVRDRLPDLVHAVERAGVRVLWVCDPMHGNAIQTQNNVKTRDFDDILREIELSMDVHKAAGTYLGGVHFELTGEDVTECIGGGVTEADLSTNYVTACDPRLNYSQALQMAFCLARRMGELARPSSIPPRSR